MNNKKAFVSYLTENLLFRIIICIFIPLLLFAILLISQNKSPIEAYHSIFTSVFGSIYGFGEVVVRASYLILTGLAASIPARVGLANAGGEGQMAIAALGTAVAGSTFLVNMPKMIGIPLMLATGMLCGAAYAGIGVFCKLKLGMNEILTTILMNYIATYFISSLLFGILRDPHGWNYPQTVEIAPQLRFHTFLKTRMNTGIFISLIVAFILLLELNCVQTIAERFDCGVMLQIYEEIMTDMMLEESAPRQELTMECCLRPADNDSVKENPEENPVTAVS